MKKETKKELIFLGCIAIFLLLFILVMTNFGEFFYGSIEDWETQHHVFPDYFRKLFYQTKNLFPNFSLHLGSGQNIYNYSYYGLLNPIILISYLLPFIDMRTYITVSTIILIYLSIILLYKWLKSKFDFKIAAYSTVLFTLSSPILFQSHKQIMFINYMPFLIMGFIGVDNYFKHNKKSLLILSVFLITSTSYYLSISAILALVVYGIYIYIKETPKIKVKSFIKDGIKFLTPIFIGILISSIILIPTFIALLQGRGDSNTKPTLITLLTLNKNTNLFLYHCRSLSATLIIIFSLIYSAITYKKENKFLSIIILLLISFPIFIYILNGTLYVSGKVLIPFIPLTLYLFSNFLTDKITNKKNITISIIIFILFCLFELIYNKDNFLLLYDIFLTVITLFFLVKKRTKTIPCIFIIIISFVAFISSNKEDELANKNIINEYNEIQTLVEYAQELDDEFYRISDGDGSPSYINNIDNIDVYKSSIYSSLTNKDYKDFYYNNIGNNIILRSTGQLSNPQNLIYNIYIGNKYVVANKDDNLLGYTPLIESQNKTLYLNELTLPVGYSKNTLMSYEEYSSLTYPYNVEAIMKYIIVNDNIESNYTSNIEKIELDYYQTYYNLSYQNNGEYYKIDSQDNGKINLKLKNKINNKILFIKFNMLGSNDCTIGDNIITINGIKNNLSCKTWKYYNNNTTFEYTIAEKEIDRLEILFEKGNYKISNIEIYTLDYDKFITNINNYSRFNIDKNKTKGDIIEGTIDVKEDGYFNLSIPYDESFTIYIDDKKINYEKVDTAFIGFKISKGMHNIKLIYKAKGVKISKIFSLIGCIFFIYILFIEHKQKINKIKKIA